MDTKRKTLAWPLLIVVASAGLAVGFGLGRISPHDEPERAPVDLNGSTQQIDDAMRRWAPKAGMTVEQVRRGYTPRLMAFPTKNCIQLEIGPVFDVGGEPIYCYRANSLSLVEEHSDVE